MAKRKYEFKPDDFRVDLFSKLSLTQKQRSALLRWALTGVVLLVLSVLQDVVFSRIHLMKATTDLVPSAIVLLCVMLGADKASVFSLIAAALYKFTGAAPGYYVIALIPFVGLITAAFRQNFFREGKGAELLCACTGVFVYEMVLFGIGIVFQNTIPERLPVFVLTAGYSLLSYIILYPIFRAIKKIGGESWID